jgi:hypothetical protein
MACTLLLSLLGFGSAPTSCGCGRLTPPSASWARYDPVILRRLLGVLGVLTTATYLAYTRSVHANGLFGTERLVWTVPFVAFGIFRFVWLTVRQSAADSPTDSMLRDPAFVTNLFLYAASVLALLYVAH